MISYKIEKVIRFFDFYSSNNFWIFANRNLPVWNMDQIVRTKSVHVKIIGNCEHLLSWNCSCWFRGAVWDATVLNELRYEVAVFNKGHGHDNTIASVPKKFHITGRRKFMYLISRKHANQSFLVFAKIHWRDKYEYCKIARLFSQIFLAVKCHMYEKQIGEYFMRIGKHISKER